MPRPTEACSRKRVYYSRTAAMIATEGRKLKKGAKALTFYKCPHCTFYHLTRSRPNRSPNHSKEPE